MRTYIQGDYLVTDHENGIVEMVLNNPLPANSNAVILAQIAELEAKQARGIRECLLTGDKTGLTMIDNQIRALRAQLK